MKKVAKFGLNMYDLDPKMFEELYERFPPSRDSPRVYDKWVDYESEEFFELMSFLTDAGLKPWNRTGQRERGHEFTLYIHRRYDQRDFDDAEYLLIDSYESDTYTVKLVPRLQERGGTPLLTGRSVKKFKKMFVGAGDAGLAGWMLLPDHVRTVLEAANFSGILFENTRVYEQSGKGEYREQSWDEYRESWWELSSEYTMPRLSSSVKLVAAKRGTELQPDFSTGCRIDEGLHMNPELHYRRSDLQAMGEFDIARAVEPVRGFLGWTHRNRPLIVSQRFYRHCQEHEIKAYWQPVRIDED